MITIVRNKHCNVLATLLNINLLINLHIHFELNLSLSILPVSFTVPVPANIESLTLRQYVPYQ